MKKIKIADITLKEALSLTFKEKIEIAKLLDRLSVDAMEIPKIEDARVDTLLVKSIASVVKNSAVVLEAGYTPEEIDIAFEAVKGAEKPVLQIALPMSIVGMEYTLRKKPAAMLDAVAELVAYAKTKAVQVEFMALDATRADGEFIKKAVDAAVRAGAARVILCDDAGEMMPDSFKQFVFSVKEAAGDAELGVSCSDFLKVAAASAIGSVAAGATVLRASAKESAAVPSVESLVNIIRTCGSSLEIQADIKTTEFKRISDQIQWICNEKHGKNASLGSVSVTEDIAVALKAGDELNTVSAAVEKLGYDLNEEDLFKVFDEFNRIASKKGTVGAKELDAIVASAALQAVPVYKLVSYVINSGNIITATADIKLEKDGEEKQAVCIGDGPIDAAFLTIEQIVGRHFELDDFQIQAVTEGREAMGSALVKLRWNGKSYSGKGLSTDIIGASIRAYVNALNKIVYQEG